MALADQVHTPVCAERTGSADATQGDNWQPAVRLAEAKSETANNGSQTGKTNTPSQPDGTTANSQNRQQSCSRFVKSFYDWYLQIAKKQNNMAPVERAEHDKASYFSADLLAQLKADSKASAQNPGEVVGLDFDPILNSQELAARYDIGKVTVKNERYKVEVYGTLNGKKSTKPDVTPELAFSNGRWTFVNFLYEGNEPPTDLLKVLKSLREERKSPHK